MDVERAFEPMRERNPGPSCIESDEDRRSVGSRAQSPHGPDASWTHHQPKLTLRTPPDSDAGVERLTV